MKKSYLLIVAFLLIGFLFYGAVHKSMPYFSEIPMERFETWKPAPFLPAGHGPNWKLGQYLENGGIFNADVDHFVLQRDGRAFDLINSRDTWGFADAISWKIDLIGDQLYVFDAHQTQEPGWFHIVTMKYDWLLPRLGMAPDGEIHKIDPSVRTLIPTDIAPGSVYRIDNGQLKFVGIMQDYDDLFEKLHTGDYYLAPPGTGVREVFDLKKTPNNK